MINLIEEENKKIKQALDATAQAKVDSGKWQATNNNGQTVIYPTGFQPMNAYPKSASSPKPVSNTTSMVDELAALQKKQKQAELERAKEVALSNLVAEGKATNERYRTDINDTATDRDIQLKNFFENTANRGQTYSGSTSQGEISQNISKQNAISGLIAAKENAAADVERRKSLAEQGYLDDVNSANTTIDMARYQNLIDLQKEQEKNAILQEQNQFERNLAQDKMALDMRDYNRLNSSNYDTTNLEQKNASDLAQIELESKLKELEPLFKAGDWEGIKALNVDPTALKTKWNADLADTYANIEDKNSNGGNLPKKTVTNFDGNVKLINGIYGDEIILSYGNGSYKINPKVDRASFVDPIIANTLDNKNLTNEQVSSFLNSIGISNSEIQRVADYYVK